MTRPAADPRALVGIGRRFLRTREPATRAIREIRADYYRESWHHAAESVGAISRDLEGGLVRITRGNQSLTMREQHTPLSDPTSDKLVWDKPLVRALLDEAGIPTPRQHIVQGTGAALEIAEYLGWPVVVKPARGTGAGAGVTTNVVGPRALRRALRWARAFGADVIVEEQRRGRVHRLLFLDENLLDGIVRNPPTVEGDGMSTIRELVEQENRLRTRPGSRRAQSLIRIDLDMRTSLEARGASASHVPDAGQVVVVKDIVNENRADENEAVGPSIHASILDLGRQVLELTGARLVGVDIIAPALDVGLDDSGGCVLELNTPPGHFYHHMRPDGFDVALRLLEHLLDGD